MGTVLEGGEGSQLHTEKGWVSLANTLRGESLKIFVFISWLMGAFNLLRSEECASPASALAKARPFFRPVLFSSCRSFRESNRWQAVKHKIDVVTLV